MAAALGHRGPDGQSHWLGPDVGLGHTRLAIIDVEGGHQPMHDAVGATVIVFNGEIYNYEELKHRLEQRGYTFRTRSDTEVIWAAIDAWGIGEGLLSLRGMFAFGLYNRRTRTLLLARDRVGIKPLYWAEVASGLIFGSEQKALLASELLPSRANLVSIHDYLGQGYPTTPATCWAGMYMLEPGTWMEVGPDGQRRGRYWEWSCAEDERLGLESGTELTRRTLLDAARSHLLSDVPVGAFLSGGLDSSLLVRLLSPEFVRDLPTFNVGFEDPEYDESAAARRVAEESGTCHHELQLATDGNPDLFARILDQYDEPFGDSSCVPSYLICREMRRHVKVVLSGDGGDEILGGYPRYLHARRLAMMARVRGALPLLQPLTRLAKRRLAAAGRQVEKAWRFAQMDPVARLCALQTYFGEDERLGLYQPEFALQALEMGPTAVRFAAFVPPNVRDPALQLMTAEIRLRLHADYLRKVDVASAAHGVEVRVPYLDNGMLDLGARLPMRLKITTRGETKVLSRRLARELLPAGIADARKRGFSIPLDRWSGPAMRSFLRALLLERDAPVARIIAPAALEKVWDDFEDARPDPTLSRHQRYQRLFMLASLALWLKRWNISIG